MSNVLSKRLDKLCPVTPVTFFVFPKTGETDAEAIARSGYKPDLAGCSCFLLRGVRDDEEPENA